MNLKISLIKSAILSARRRGVAVSFVDHMYYCAANDEIRDKTPKAVKE